MQWLLSRPWWFYVIAVLAVLFVVDAMGMFLGDGSIDPTDPSNFNS